MAEDPTDELAAMRGRVAAAVGRLQRPATFAVSGGVDLDDPGLVVDGVGQIELPLSDAQARAIRQVAHQAPYGKGTRTLVDTEVRNCWELDPDRFRLTAPGWAETERILAGGTASEFGLDVRSLEGHLYKLLLYEQGSFFLPHRDGEKLDGMVATLVVTLPGHFRGGELVVRHGSRTVVCPLEAAAAGQHASYAAFYADCEHEVRELSSGYRLSLVYNLTINPQANAHVTATAPDVDAWRTELRQALRSWADASPEPLLAIPLEHQYSAAGLSLSTLKGADRAKVEATAEAAAQEAMVAHVALLNWHQMGLAEYANGHPYYGRRRRGYFWGDDEDWGEPEASHNAGEEDNGASGGKSPYTMLEVYEEKLWANHWMAPDGRRPTLGDINISLQSIAGDTDLDQWKRTQEEFEGYTGNAGMTLERWYCRAAIVLWPREHHFRVLVKAGTQAALGGLEAMLGAADAQDDKQRAATLWECGRFAEEILATWDPEKSDGFDFSTGAKKESPPDRVADPLELFLRLGDAQLVERYLVEVATQRGDQPLDCLDRVCKHFGWQRFAPQLSQVMRDTGEKTVVRNARILAKLAGLRDRNRQRLDLCRSLADEFIDALIAWDVSRDCSFWSYQQVDRTVLLASTIKALSRLAAEEVLRRFLQHTLADSDHYDLRSVHAAAVASLQAWLVEHGSANKPVIEWLETLRSQFEDITAVAPAAPQDLRRSCPVQCTCKDCEKLKAFMADPNILVYEFSVKAERRQHLHQIIAGNRLDLTHVTRRSGRPFPLVCTKTEDSYNRAAQIHRDDLKRLQLIRELI